MRTERNTAICSKQTRSRDTTRSMCHTIPRRRTARAVPTGGVYCRLTDCVCTFSQLPSASLAVAPLPAASGSSTAAPPLKSTTGVSAVSYEDRRSPTITVGSAGTAERMRQGGCRASNAIFQGKERKVVGILTSRDWRVAMRRNDRRCCDGALPYTFAA